MKAILSKEAGGYDLYRINEDGKRVTFASTQDYKQKLSLKNCQEIERGYDLDELAEKETEKYATLTPKSFKRGFLYGFQKALEILGDRKFTEEDVRKAMDRVWDWCEDEKDVDCSSMTELRGKHIQSLQQNEWDVEVEMDDFFTENEEVYVDETDARGNYSTHNKKPKLDADGCIILKRVV